MCICFTFFDLSRHGTRYDLWNCLWMLDKLYGKSEILATLNYLANHKQREFLSRAKRSAEHFQVAFFKPVLKRSRYMIYFTHFQVLQFTHCFKLHKHFYKKFNFCFMHLIENEIH